MTAQVEGTPEEGFDLSVPVLIIGSGAAGMVAALSAREAGVGVLVLEADAAPSGSTALSAGLIPAAGTSFQRSAGIEDDPRLFAQDIQKKAKGENADALVTLLDEACAIALEELDQEAVHNDLGAVPTTTSRSFPHQ